jgi:hypothetical protein
MDNRIKVLWPDGPRMVDPEYVIDAAHDSLCDDWLASKDPETDDLPEDLSTVVPRPSLEEAIEIVNDRGILTTARLDSVDDDWDDPNGPDESMDGDHQSALASCGMGDEDYGCYDGGEDF